MDLLRKGGPITVEEGKTLFRESGKYLRTVPDGRMEISRKEAVAELRAFIERVRREQRKGKR